MSGWEVIGLVLALYPIVETAVKAYGEAKPGHTASSLVRKLKTEAMIYDQFVRNLLEPVLSGPVIERLLDRASDKLPETWQDGELHKELLGRLGPIKSAHLLSMLLEMDTRLKALERELINISRGTEVLEKFRTRLRAARANLPKSRVQTNLTAVSEINKDLRRLLESDAISVAHLGTTKGRGSSSRSGYVRFLHRESIDLRELYDIMRHGYVCTCDEPHLATLGCHCPSCQEPFSHSPSKARNSSWTPELLLWPSASVSSSDPEWVVTASENGNGQAISVVGSESDEGKTPDHHVRAISLPGPELLRSAGDKATPAKRRSYSISVSPSRETEHHCSDQTEIIQDLCATINSFGDQDGQKGSTTTSNTTTLGILGKENKKYRLSVNSGAHRGGGIATTTIVRPTDLIRAGAPALSTKKRLQIAFQLCLAVLQLCTTPWIDDSWTWDERCVVRKVEAASPSQLLQEDHRQDGDEYDEWRRSGAAEDDKGRGFFEPRDESYHLFVTQQFYSAGQKKQGQQQQQQQRLIPPHLPPPPPARPTTVLNLLAGEPVGPTLVKLGCALIELGFGRTMRDIRDEKPADWLGGLEKTLDAASLDFVTARKLLESGSVEAEVGIDYANVVKACVHRQYQYQCHQQQQLDAVAMMMRDGEAPGGRGGAGVGGGGGGGGGGAGGIRNFSFGGETFFDCAEEAIMKPLYDWIQLFG